MPVSSAPARVFASGAFVALACAGLLGLACGTEPVGVDACRRIEHVRCESAAACGIDLSMPVHRGDSPASDVNACKRYYDDACLHGLATTKEPGNVAVQACIDAIITGSCDVVRTPESDPACAFLIPPAAPAPAPVDAGTDATITVDAGLPVY